MPTSAEYPVKFVPLQGLKDEFRRLKETNPEIIEANKLFNEYKRQKPPKRLPKKMKDHHLEGSMDGFRECHYSNDILLIYTHENDVVTMCMLCEHAEFYGKRGASLQATLNKRIKSLK